MNKKRRKDCFFGLHFDFHANEQTQGIYGKDNRQTLCKILDETKPDFIQIDTKGHNGLTSYFSKYAPVAPGLVNDQLKMIREETAKRNVLLYAHHTGLYNAKACGAHHEWAVLNRDNTMSKNTIDPTSDYAAEVLIPCLTELCEDYGLDGAWIDGECWQLKESYKQEELEEFYRKTGYDKVGEGLDDSHMAYIDFWRQKFKEYVTYYMNKVHKTHPEFEMCSSYAFSTYMPEKPFDCVDYMSGDIQGMQCRLEPRCFAGKGKAWDIMTWGSSTAYITEDGPMFFPIVNKHPERICREAAMAISQGGAFQLFYHMTPQGEIRKYELGRMKKVSGFMEKRRKFNQYSEPMKNTGFLLSAYSNLRRQYVDDIGGNGIYRDMGIYLCDLLLDGGIPCDIIYDYQLDNPQRDTIVISNETYFISEDMERKLKKFVENGGNLIVCGKTPCERLSDMIRADVKEFDGYMVYAECDDNMFGMHNAVVFEKHGAEDLINCYKDNMNPEAQRISAVVTDTYGKGRVVFIGFELMTEYGSYHRFEQRDMMCKILRMVEKEPNAYLESGIKRVEIIPAKKDDKILINLINISELNCDNYGTAADEIPPIYDITIAVKCDKKPKKIMLEPEHIEPEYTYDGKYAHVKVDKLHIHRIIAVE